MKQNRRRFAENQSETLNLANETELLGETAEYMGFSYGYEISMVLVAMCF